MKIKKYPYKGTRDLFPKEKRIQDYIFNKMELASKLFGYENYTGPLLEELNLYKAKSGQELSEEQVYNFIDKGDREVVIRPEMTPTLARMISQIYKEEVKPIRWYTICNLMRYENPQKGRLREHWQLNCDIFGAPIIYGELEILQILIHLLESLGATQEHFECLVNSRKITNVVIKEMMNLDKNHKEELYKIIDKAKKISKEDFKKSINKLSLSEKESNILKEYLNLNKFTDVINFLNKNNYNEIAEEIKKFSNAIESSYIGKYIKYDPTIVRGIAYYTGFVFELYDKHPENKRAICGGGTYDNLLEIFGEGPLNGVGFGMGDVVITDFLNTHNLLPNMDKPNNDIYISFQVDNALEASIKLANELRKKEIYVIINYSKSKRDKALKNARKKAKFIAMIDEKEIEKDSVVIQELSSNNQITLLLNDLNKIVKFIRHGS